MKTIISGFDMDYCIEFVMQVIETGLFNGGRTKKELNVLDEEDVESALSKALGRTVRLSEVECTLNYCIPMDTLEPCGMYLVFKVGEEMIWSGDLFVDDCLNGKKLSLIEPFLPVKGIFSFDPSAFRSFEISVDGSD